MKKEIKHIKFCGAQLKKSWEVKIICMKFYTEEQESQSSVVSQKPKGWGGGNTARSLKHLPHKPDSPGQELQHSGKSRYVHTSVIPARLSGDGRHRQAKPQKLMGELVWYHRHEKAETVLNRMETEEPPSIVFGADLHLLRTMTKVKVKAIRNVPRCPAWPLLAKDAFADPAK